MTAYAGEMYPAASAECLPSRGSRSSIEVWRHTVNGEQWCMFSELLMIFYASLASMLAGERPRMKFGTESRDQKHSMHPGWMAQGSNNRRLQPSLDVGGTVGALWPFGWRDVVPLAGCPSSKMDDSTESRATQGMALKGQVQMSEGSDGQEDKLSLSEILGYFVAKKGE